MFFAKFAGILLNFHQIDDFSPQISRNVAGISKNPRNVHDVFLADVIPASLSTLIRSRGLLGRILHTPRYASLFSSVHEY